MAYASLMALSNSKRLILRKHVNLLGLRVQAKSSLTPMGGWMGDLFKAKTILKNWETIPIFITLFINLALPIVHSVLHIRNMNDIRYWPGSRMKCEKHRWILEGPPTPTVYMVVQQKWEWPQGLLDALTEPTEDDANDCSSGKKTGCPDKNSSDSRRKCKKNK